MTNSAYTLDDTGARARYQSLWEHARGIFASLRYAEAASSVFGLKPKICFHEDEAALLLHLKGGGKLRHVVIPPFTQYSALLLLNPPPAHLIHRQKTPLDELLKSAEQISNRADLLVTMDDPRTAQWRGWEVKPLFTYLIHLPADPDDWSSGARRTWRSNTSDYTIRENSELAGEVIDLCRMSYQRHGRKLPASPTALETLVREMGDWGRVFVAERNGITEAGAIILHDEHTAHYWIAGSIPGPSMTVLLGEILPLLSESGISVFDFVGANTPSIAEFKRSFAPALTQYYHLRRRPRIHFGR
ncbi:MAG: GNAT family N-acetyltransferase [Bacteroidetes bacterium]|nr:GNAT family N-acetyltransferase [Bacteroidota bacterium]MCY4205650.1 GNAT family N-acetyltransferase [Bacteroidota bacterium]